VYDQPVWSITCFFVKKEARGEGIMEPLVKAAVKHARDHGGRFVEAYSMRFNAKNNEAKKSK